jgi:hypothetical protein
MLEKLKSHPEIRRALGIAAGVFLALVAYRFLFAFIAWWNEQGGDYWYDDPRLGLFFCVAILVGLPAWAKWGPLPRFIAPPARPAGPDSRRRSLLLYVVLPLSVLVLAILVRWATKNAISQYNRQQLEKQDSMLQVPAPAPAAAPWPTDSAAAPSLTGDPQIDAYTVRELQKQNACLQASLAAAAKNNPRLMVQARQLGLRVGVGPSIAEHNMAIVRRIALQQQTTAESLPQTAPRLATLLKNSIFSGVACDDLGNRQQLEKQNSTLPVGQKAGDGSR